MVRYITSRISNTLTSLAVVLVVLAAPAQGDICAFGYTGMMNTTLNGSTYVVNSNVSEIFDQFGMRMDTISWHFQKNTQGLDITPHINQIKARGALAALDITRMLFYQSNQPTTCSGYGGASVMGKDLAYTDWKARLDTFIDINAADLVPKKLRMIVVHAEANNGCVPQGLIDQIAYHIKIERGITVPLGVGLPTTYVNSAYHAQPLPPHQPWWIDYIITWSYGVWNPNQPNHPRNANVIFGHSKVFFNPSYPSDPATLWGELLAWKRPYQKIAFVLDSHCTDFLHEAINWSQCNPDAAWELGIVANNFRTWALAQPEIDQMYPFTWPSPDTDPSDGDIFLGARNLHPFTRNDHQAIADEAFLCEP